VYVYICIYIYIYIYVSVCAEPELFAGSAGTAQGGGSSVHTSSGVERSEGERVHGMPWEQAEEECADFVVITVPLGVLKVRVYVHTCTCICVCMYVYMCVHVRVYVRA
jgi:hypothetical protein